MSIPHKMMETILRASIADQIRNLRISNGLTQEDLAKGIGTQQSAIARLEDHHADFPTVETLRRIAKFFNVALRINFASYSEFVKEYCNGPLRVPMSFSDELAESPTPSAETVRK